MNMTVLADAMNAAGSPKANRNRARRPRRLVEKPSYNLLEQEAIAEHLLENHGVPPAIGELIAERLHPGWLGPGDAWRNKLPEALVLSGFSWLDSPEGFAFWQSFKDALVDEREERDKAFPNTIRWHPNSRWV